MDRVILHCDLNNFYASVECLHHPELRDKPVAVCGDAELRRGIVLAKNYHAKKYGIKTGDVIWEAQKKCPELITVTANFLLYLEFSERAKKIYSDYTDRIEPFGIDECWLDVTGSIKLKGSGQTIADEIRERMRTELGCTVSVGVSWNKIFAKLGSDMKKPDATTVVSKENYKQTVFNLPAEDLLYVGRATRQKLYKYGINTIGKIAEANPDFLKAKLGKWGETVWAFANGLDSASVALSDSGSQIKSVGNSATCARDLINLDDVRIMTTVMAESVASRLREQGLKGQVVSIFVKDKNLNDWGKQHKINEPTFLSETIIKTAMKLFEENYDFKTPLRSVGVCVSDLIIADSSYQTDFLFNEEQRKKSERLEFTVDNLRERFGHSIIKRGTLCLDTKLSGSDPKSENVIYPHSFFK